MPRSQVSLGLDLQGGSHILLEVDVAAGIKDRLNVTMPDVRRALQAPRPFDPEDLQQRILILGQ